MDLERVLEDAAALDQHIAPDTVKVCQYLFAVIWDLHTPIALRTSYTARRRTPRRVLGSN